jgi:hypothetical protein
MYDDWITRSPPSSMSAGSDVGAPTISARSSPLPSIWKQLGRGLLQVSWSFPDGAST